MFRAKLVRPQPDEFTTNNKSWEKAAPAADPGPGVATPREIDGVTFTGQFALYDGAHDESLGFGVPTQAQLDADDLIIETLTGDPWPNSATDRFGKREGKNRMLLRKLNHEWPTADEREMQGICATRKRDREAFAREKLAESGMQPHEIEAVVRKTVIPLVNREKREARPNTAPAAKPAAKQATL